MKFLGIDYSLNGTGLSVYDGKDIIYKKVFTTVKKHYESDKDTFILSPKFDNMYDKMDWVCETIINCTDYDYVCMENHIGNYYDWMDGYGIIKHYLRKKKVPHILISPTQLKKFANSGKADKTQMSYYLRRNYGFDFDFLGESANNIVDASWLAIVCYSYHELSNLSNLSKDRKDILTNLTLN